MTVTVDVQNRVGEGVPEEAELHHWAAAALDVVQEPCELSIRIVDKQESAELNARYRGREGPTNVLSFPFESPVPITPRLLGDLVICAPLVAQEAQRQGKLVRHHWAHLVVHGCLHLLGYDHIEDVQAKEMEALEVNILHTLDIENPYQERQA